MSQDWDYIVVGAGSSGCVLAERLSADGRSRVLLLEAGGENGFWNQLPKGVAKLVGNPEKVWLYKVTQPREEGAEANEFWIRGKGLGGSSSVNGMIWSRGEPEDYDAWERDKGATGWNGATMTEAFKQLEDHAAGASDMRGSGGPVYVDPAIYSYPLAERIIDAGETMGLRRVDDLNGTTGPRVGLYSHNVKRGKRQSAAVTFLEPARSRENLDVVTHALAERIVFDGKRAIGVEARVRGQKRTFECRGEVIVCAGAMESPLLLQRSGIGSGERLKAAGVELVAESPDVGERMIEHLAVSFPYRLEKGKGTHRNFYGLGLARAMARYLVTGGGIMATGPFEVGAFLNVFNPDGRTDAQFYLGAYTFEIGDDNDPVPLDKIDRRPGVTIYGQLLRLTSEGSLQIAGPSLDDAPVITPNFLTTEHDRRSAIALVRRMREFMDSEPLGSMLGEEVLPGRDVDSDEEILASFRRLATCGLHAIGTCRMGSDNRAVTDPKLKVNGVEGVRVVDCSVMPGHVTGNTNAPAMALGLVASKLILEDRP
ncbi:GMC oxidoreductase [Novosphingobium marinum]|uniref:Choline dehydrogenase-like flavoprotein n=1 Tax=Novosphingobium marinum TaxID=1514948 RepID=A0A7Z0BTY2_9SPHN|nr:GMC family oxidoreductase N-terminal domain-containing protein [Novosphingobium marinum]NYH93740.1 choline dehydrogenase-like flavoprotein [Novosphingobium marinum]GGC16950.1 GMC oxidoreductase [Novosphingobium marinum]